MKLLNALVILGMTLMVALPMSAKDKTPSYNFSRAMDEVQKGNTQTALEYFNKEINENPKNGCAYLAMTAIHLENKDYGDARNTVESALKHMPKKDKASVSRIYELRGKILAIEGDTVAAYSDLATSIKLDPANEEAYEKRAQLLYEQKRYDEADADYLKLAELNPGGVMGRMGLGRNAFARKDYDKAIEQYTRIITLYPDYSSGYSFRAQAYLAKKDYFKAMDDVCKALEIDSDPKAFHLLFDFPADQLTLVTTKLRGMSAKNPNTGEYEYYIGLLYGNNRMYEQANEALERAFEIDAHSGFLEQIADNHSEMGGYAKALAYIERASQMDPDNDELIINRADTLGESGDIDGAIATWGEFIKKNPDFWGGYYRRGFFEDNSGRTEAALADYDMAIMLSPDYAYAYLGKGDMLEKLGRHDEAVEAYRKWWNLTQFPTMIRVPCMRSFL